MADARRIYLDACVFIDIAKIAIGKEIETERENDVWHAKKLLEAARDRELEVYTSTLSIAECTHVGTTDLNELVKQTFSSLLMSGQYVRLVQTTPFIAEDARDLLWKHGIRLRGADGIHVASALDRKCEELLTSDTRMQRLVANRDKLEKLGLRVISARNTLCLPEKYRQLGLMDDKKDAGFRRKGPELH